MTVFKFGWFPSHSGLQLPWKIDCDGLSYRDWEAIAKIVAWKFAFSRVIAVPRGGVSFASACEWHAKDPEYPPLIVDDVLTTGRSMEKAKAGCGHPNPIGVVLFARAPCPNWIWPIFSVNDWAQSRATGLG